MEVDPNGSSAYFDHLDHKAEFDQNERDSERHHLEKIKIEEMRHRERMKALELGIAPQASRAPLAWVCIAIGAGVPIGVTALISQASMIRPGFDQDIWMLVPANGLPAMLLAGILAWRGLLPRGEPARLPVAKLDKEKELDPDAYDVVGRRG